MYSLVIALILAFPLSANKKEILFPEKLSSLGIYQDIEKKILDPRFVSFDVNHSLWSDCAKKSRWISIPLNSQIGPSDIPSEIWKFPEGTILIKNFEFQFEKNGYRLIETRIALKILDGWKLNSYLWNVDQKDAVRVDGIQDLQLEGLLSSDACTDTNLTWTVPDSQSCTSCHGQSQTQPLAMKTSQLNKGLQINDWNNRGWLKQMPSVGNEILSSIDDSSTTIENRARSYLDVQCASCHSPRGYAPGGIDFRFQIPLDSTNTTYVPDSILENGVTMYRILPGDAKHSSIISRMEKLDQNHMPAFGSRVVDQDAVEILKKWIEKLK